MGKRKNGSEQGHKRSKKKDKGKGWSTKKKSPILNRKCTKREQPVKKTRCPRCNDKINETYLSEHLLNSHGEENKWAAIEESPEVGPSKVQSSPDEEQDENETTHHLKMKFRSMMIDE